MPHPEPPLTETAYAKINLALHVRERRDDGYHTLESLFVFARDGDQLSAVRAKGLTLTVDGPFGPSLGQEDDNLVLRAARALQAATGTDQGAHIHLDKRLPVASGIGGGSADAAATLRLLMRLWRANLPAPALHDLALTLGSDVPACLASRTQLVGGRGETLGEAHVRDLAEAPLLLVNPGVPVSTGPVFAGWDRIDRGALRADSLTALSAARNDLEPPAMLLAPVIAEVLATLRSQPGVTLSRMSGSGATCFALFADTRARDAATQALRAAHPAWWCMESTLR